MGLVGWWVVDTIRLDSEWWTFSTQSLAMILSQVIIYRVFLANNSNFLSEYTVDIGPVGVNGVKLVDETSKSLSSPQPPAQEVSVPLSHYIATCTVYLTHGM